MNKIMTIAICFVFVVTSFVFADKLTFRNGEDTDVEDINYEDGVLTTSDGQTLTPAELSTLTFTKGEFTQKKVGADTISQEEIKKLQQKAKELEKQYPDEGYLVLIDDGIQQLRSDGTQWSRSRYTLKIVRNKYRDRANIRLYLEEERERINLVFARTINPDGEVYYLDEKDITISEPNRGAVFFSRGKNFSFQLPNAQEGSIIDYCWEKEVYNPFHPEMFFPQWYFQSEAPVWNSTVEVIMPPGKPLNYKIIAVEPDDPKAIPKTWEDEEGLHYKWSMSDMPPVITEPEMDSWGDVVPHLIGSPFKTWDTIYEWAQKKQKERLKPDEKVQKLVDELIAGAKTDDAKIAAIYHWLQKEIRYISVKGGIGSGFAGHRPAETLKNGFGDCIDKATLFSAMLKAAGITGYPVYLYTNDLPLMHTEIPRLTGNHAITKVILDDREFFLDCTGDCYRYPSFSSGDHGVQCVIPLEEKTDFIPLPEPEDNASKQTISINLEADGSMLIEKSYKFSGDPEAGFRSFFLHTQDSDRERYLAGWLSRQVPGAQYIGYEASNHKDLSIPFEMKLKFSLDRHPTFADDLMIFTIPTIDYSFSEVSLDERKYPIEYSSSMYVSHDVTIQVPEGYKVLSLPSKYKGKHPYGSYKAVYKKKKSHIIFEDELIRDIRLVDLEAYPEWRDFLRDIAGYGEEVIVLQEREK